MKRAERFFVWLWIIISLAWAGFIIGTRFRIGDAYATGFSLIDLEIIAGPPLGLLLIGSAIALVARKVFH
jgi:hypothetical protein